jgi:hypothetical protein
MAENRMQKIASRFTAGFMILHIPLSPAPSEDDLLVVVGQQVADEDQKKPERDDGAKAAGGNA